MDISITAKMNEIGVAQLKNKIKEEKLKSYILEIEDKAAQIELTNAYEQKNYKLIVNKIAGDFTKSGKEEEIILMFDKHFSFKTDYMFNEFEDYCS